MIFMSSAHQTRVVPRILELNCSVCGGLTVHDKCMETAGEMVYLAANNIFKETHK